MKTRLFIGNLAPTVTEKDLREKFVALFSDHKNETEVGNVEVRCKNESNFFGYVDIHSKIEVQDGGGKVPLHLRKYIDLMNNTKWKGSLIKVQVAKESFIDKLRKEQQNRKDSGNNYGKANHDEHLNSNEISTEQSRNQRQAMDVLYKMNRSKDRTKGRHLNGQNKHSDETKPAKCDFEIVGVEKDKPAAKASSPPKQKKKRHKAESSSSDDDDSDDDIRDGIPKFKGLLLSYPEGIPPPAPAPPSETVAPAPKITRRKEKDQPEGETETLIEGDEDRPPIQQKLLNLAFESDPPKHQNSKSTSNSPQKLENAVNEINSVINFKKNKQQKSDQLRLQSWEKLKDLKTQRKNLIKSSLAGVTAAAPVTEKRKVFEAEVEQDDEISVEPESKKTKMTLFDEEENDQDTDNEDDVFGVKKQFEGVQGQKLLEMQTRWGNDERFKIDDRFKESDEDSDHNNEEPVEKEKEKQLNILTDILGKDFTSAPKDQSKKSKKSAPASNAFSSVILPRYDPEAEEEKDETCKTEAKNKKSKKGQEKEAATAAATAEEPKPIRSTEPATYKTASNLKEMFSSSQKDEEAKSNDKQSDHSKVNGSNTQPSFSLLAAFGSTPDEDDDEAIEEMPRGSKKKSTVEDSGPRSFWQSNPFRYDSSDDEDEGKNVKDKKVTADNAVKAKFPSDMKVHGKTPFFFTDNDDRFDGLEDYFLNLDDYEGKSEGDKGEQKDEKSSGRVEDFSEKRQELKAIVKAKIRNSKRKDEKRTLAIKRAIRKRKRKIHQNKRTFPTK